MEVHDKTFQPTASACNVEKLPETIAAAKKIHAIHENVLVQGDPISDSGSNGNEKYSALTIQCPGLVVA
jgi:hypothetical protein